MITINTILDMRPGAVPKIIHLSQYDSDFSLVFRLHASFGTLNIESGTTAEIRGTKKSGTGYSASATLNVSNSTVTVAGDAQMTAVAGQNVYEIVLIKNNKVLGSANFILLVERAALDADTITDASVLRELNAIVEGAETATQAAEEAEDAADRAEAAAQSLVIDSTLTQSGQAADAKATGDAIAGLENEIAQIVHGLSSEAKDALLACFEHVAWTGGNGQFYYNALANALNNADYPMITASYVSSGHVVHANDSLESLRPYLTVVYYETEESSGTTVSDYTLSTSSPLIPGVNLVIVQYNGLQNNFSINVANPIYEYVPPEGGYSNFAKWADHTQIEGLYNNADGYLPVKGLSVAGISVPTGGDPGKYWYSYIACPQEQTGRAISNTQIIVGNFDGKKIGLHSYVLSSGATVSFNVFYGLVNNGNRTFSGYLVYENEDVDELKKFGGWTFYNSEQTLPTSASTNLRFVEVSFRKGNSSVDFTDAEIAELVGLLYIE